MKVVHTCIRYDAPGGAETHVHAVTERLADRGHDVVVHTSSLRSEVPWEEMEDPTTERNGVSIRRHAIHRHLLPGLRYPVMPELPGALLDEEADLIHAHSHRYYQVAAASMVARATDTPLVITPHYHPVRENLAPWKKVLARFHDWRARRNVYLPADRVLPVTGLEAETMTRFAPRDRITVVPNGIDLDEWTPPPEPAADGWEEPVWCYAGRLAGNKTVPDAVEAFAIDRRERGRGTFLVMGKDWGQLEAVEARARELGVEDHVEVLGYVARDRYRQVMARADVFVLPSEWEAFGIVLLEAWMAGTPVVATEVGGVPWVVDDGRDGLLAPHGDPQALAEAAGLVLADPERARRMAERGREKTRKRFTWDRVVDQVEAVYREETG